MSAFLVYQQFPNAEVAQPLLTLLEQHAIAFETGSDQPAFDVTFANNAVNNRFEVKLRPQDFDRVRQLEEEQSRRLTATVDPEHYLFEFSNQELFEVLLKADEWSSLDVTLARRILQERGQDVSPEWLAQMRQQRLTDLARPAARPTGWILAGYALAVLGGLVGFFIGLHLTSSRTTLPDGRRVLSFSPSDQRHGRLIMGLSVVGIVGGVLARLYLP